MQPLAEQPSGLREVASSEAILICVNGPGCHHCFGLVAGAPGCGLMPVFRGQKMSDQEPLIGPEDDPLIGLQGRIIALEFLMRGLLAIEAMKRPDPIASLHETKSALYASLQTLGRPY